jgi:hypothetical protein
MSPDDNEPLKETTTPSTPSPKSMKILTAAGLAKLRQVSDSYICRLCRLPAEHPLHIKSIKINRQMYWITDSKVLAEVGDEYCSGV